MRRMNLSSAMAVLLVLIFLVTNSTFAQEAHGQESGETNQAITQTFGGQVKARSAAAGETIIKQADGSWAPGSAGGGTPALSDVLGAGNTTGDHNIVPTTDNNDTLGSASKTFKTVYGDALVGNQGGDNGGLTILRQDKTTPAVEILGNTNVTMASDWGLSWVSTTNAHTGTQDVKLTRGGSGLLYLGSASDAQSGIMKAYQYRAVGSGQDHAYLNGDTGLQLTVNMAATWNSAANFSGTDDTSVKRESAGRLLVEAGLGNGGGSVDVDTILVGAPSFGNFIYMSTAAAAFSLKSSLPLSWTDGNAAGGSIDVGVSRRSPGVLSIGNGTANSVAGQWELDGTTGAGTLAPTWTNSPTSLTGAQNPYTWLKFLASDGTQVYVAAFK